MANFTNTGRQGAGSGIVATLAAQNRLATADAAQKARQLARRRARPAPRAHMDVPQVKTIATGRARRGDGASK